MLKAPVFNLLFLKINFKLICVNCRVKSVCLLNEQVVFDDVYDLTHGSLVGIVHDQVRVSVTCTT